VHKKEIDVERLIDIYIQEYREFCGDDYTPEKFREFLTKRIQKVVSV